MHHVIQPSEPLRRRLRIAGWALLLLSTVFAFAFETPIARLMMLMLAGTGAWFTGLVRLPGADASDFEHDHPGRQR
jgi:hypothetical protein